MPGGGAPAPVYAPITIVVSASNGPASSHFQLHPWKHTHRMHRESVTHHHHLFLRRGLSHGGRGDAAETYSGDGLAQMRLNGVFPFYNFKFKSVHSSTDTRNRQRNRKGQVNWRVRVLQVQVQVCVVFYRCKKWAMKQALTKAFS